MFRFKYFFLVALTLGLGGCASTKQPIVSLAKDTYMLSVVGFKPQYKQSALIAEANSFCRTTGMNFMLDRVDKKIRQDGNGEIDIYFNCVSDSEYKRAQYNKEADIKIDVQNKQ